jgi:peptidyl-prolyl cis-trans isomerase D
VLQSLVGEALIEEEAAELGVSVADTLVRDEIFLQNVFAGENGQFDRSRYEQILRQNRLTTEIYEERVRAGIRTEQLIRSVTGNRAAPRALADALYSFRNETRNARIAIIPNDASADIGSPSESDIETYYNEHAARFTAPEYRAITYLLLTPESILSEIELNEADVRAEYDARGAVYDSPERREVRQILSTDEALIREGHDMLAAGQSFDEVSQALEARGATALAMGGIERAGLPAEAGDIVFALDAGNASAPVQTPLGWHLFLVDTIEPARRIPFEEVRDELHREMAMDAAIDSLYRLSTVLEDELAGGAALEQAGAAVGVAALSVAALDQRGLDTAGTLALGDLADAAEIVQTAFTLESGSDSTLIESQAGNYFVLRVDNITAPALKPLDSVRDRAVAGWQDEARANQAQLAAERLAERVRNGESLAGAAQDSGFEVVLASELTRDGAPRDRGISPQILAGLFGQDPKAPEPVVGEVGEGYAVAMLTQVTAADPAKESAFAERLGIEVGRERGADISAIYRFALHTQHEVSTNRTALQAFLEAQ